MLPPEESERTGRERRITGNFSMSSIVVALTAKTKFAKKSDPEKTAGPATVLLNDRSILAQMERLPCLDIADILAPAAGPDDFDSICARCLAEAEMQCGGMLRKV